MGDNWAQGNYPRQGDSGRRYGQPAVPPQFGRAGQDTPGARPQAYAPQYQSPPQQQYFAPPPPQFIQRPYQAPPQYVPAPQTRYNNAQQYRSSAPRKKRRVFLWGFLAVQVLFVVLIITQIAAHPAGPTAVQLAAQQCAHGGWQGLFKSQADCDKHYAVALNDATNVGKGIGAVLIVGIWVVIDFFLGLGYGIYRLASRR